MSCMTICKHIYLVNDFCKVLMEIIWNRLNLHMHTNIISLTEKVDHIKGVSIEKTCLILLTSIYIH